MESDYYKLKFELKDGSGKSLVLLMANSCLLDCMTDFSSNNADCDKMNVKVGEKRVLEHYQWIEEKLKKYSEDPDVAWLGVVMHHSIFVVPGVKQDLLPMLRKYKVDMAIVGHNHQFEYSNLGPNDDILFPGRDYGEVIDDCKDKEEIINTPTRLQEFKKGEVLHQFMVGASGKSFDPICPYREQDGKVYFKNIRKHGMMSIEVDSKHFTAKYLEGVNNVVYQVNINA